MNEKRLARFVPGGVPKLMRVFDNGGRTADRYTVQFTGRYGQKTGGERWFLNMNSCPYHPQYGIGMHAGYSARVHGYDVAHSAPDGKRIRFRDLPPDCQRAAMSDYLYLWDLAEEHDREAVAREVLARGFAPEPPKKPRRSRSRAFDETAHYRCEG